MEKLSALFNVLSGKHGTAAAVIGNIAVATGGLALAFASAAPLVVASLTLSTAALAVSSWTAAALDDYSKPRQLIAVKCRNNR